MSEFVEIKTADLIGAALDWAVGYSVRWHDVESRDAWARDWLRYYSPSTDGAYGGPLIEKYAVTLTPFAISFDGDPSYWLAQPWDQRVMPVDGPTHLIAACRAIVASVLGETVSVPKELV